GWRWPPVRYCCWWGCWCCWRGIHSRKVTRRLYKRKGRAPPSERAPQKLHSMMSGGGQVIGGRLAGPLVLDDLVVDLLAFIETVEARALNSRDVNEHVRPTLVGLDESIALLTVEPLDGTCCHNARSLVQIAAGGSRGRAASN